MSFAPYQRDDRERSAMRAITISGENKQWRSVIVV